MLLNLVLNSFQYWFSISFCQWGEILKRPMKQVQGMVQDDGPRNFKYFCFEFQMQLVRLSNTQ